MIAISSHKPHTESGEYRENQIRALNSWKPVFERIYYFGPEEPELANNKTFFVPSEQFPKIKDMVLAASNLNGDYAVLLNADIVLGRSFPQVIDKMRQENLLGGISRRYTFTPPESPESGKITDYGLDVFVGMSDIWRKAYKVIPDEYRIGNIVWDAWMSGLFNADFKRKVADFTNYKCVFHPMHQGRTSPYNHTVPQNSNYLKFASVPARKL